MNRMIATILCAGVLASVSALADDAVVPQGDNGAVKEQLQQDKATVKADREKLQADRKKMKEDRAKLKHKRHKHKKNGEQKPAEQPKTS